MEYRKVENFIIQALAYSLYIAPKNKGLTYHELHELAALLKFGKGEVEDVLKAMMRQGALAPVDGRLWLRNSGYGSLAGGFDPSDFSMRYEPERRNINVFDYVWREFKNLARDQGRERASIDRSVLVARGRDAGFEEHDLDVAIESFTVVGRLQVKEHGILQASPHYIGYPLPSVSTTGIQFSPSVTIPNLESHVDDLVARRSDGRLLARSPINAFEELLAELGHESVRTWWRQTAGELARADSALSPLTTIVLSAALAEAALELVSQRARSTGTSMTKKLSVTPKERNFLALTRAAKTGSQPILNQDLGARCELLNDRRQRIHVGRYLGPDSHPGAMDSRPEEAREARETLERLVRRIIDWVTERRES